MYSFSRKAVKVRVKETLHLFCDRCCDKQHYCTKRTNNVSFPTDKSNKKVPIIFLLSYIHEDATKC